MIRSKANRIVKEHERVMCSVRVLWGRVGRRPIQREALLLQREIASRWKRWRVDSADGSDDVSSLPITPTDRQDSKWAVIFRSLSTERVWPCIVAAPSRVKTLGSGNNSNVWLSPPPIREIDICGTAAGFGDQGLS